MEKVLAIASGEVVADYLRNHDVDNVYAFNEAMCEGEIAADMFSREFCEQRAKAYDISGEEYVPFYKTLTPLLSDVDRLELYFDHDMFCAVNTITLLAFLEKTEFKGSINFNMVPQDGTATVLDFFPVTLGKFGHAYQKALVERTHFETGVRHLDTAILLYLEYKEPDNEIIRYIRHHNSVPRRRLCGDILIEFADYGIGDIAIMKMIDASSESVS